MESDPSKFRVTYIHPRNDFGSFGGVLELAAKSASRAADGSSHRIELVESAADIRVNPRLFELPLIALIVDLAGAVVAEPTLFLADTALASRSLTGDTVRTYAEALIPWLCYVDDSELTLNDVTEETICVYRARVSHMAKRGTDVPYASATVNQRVVVPAMFHEWGQRKNIMPSSLGKFLCTADTNVAWRAFPFSSRYRVSRLQRIATPRVIARLPVSLSINEIQRLFLVTPMPYRLMLKWSVASGLRRFEICDLRVTDLPTPQQIECRSDGMLQLPMLRKGGKEADVYVPSTLLEETNWYVLTERGTPKFGCENVVFLNSSGGKVSRQSLTRAFRESATDIGSDATLHHLRHTFAVHVLKFLEERMKGGEQLNSLKTLQILLSHSNVLTTEVYLQAYQISGGDTIKALDFLYGATL